MAIEGFAETLGAPINVKTVPDEFNTQDIAAGMSKLLNEHPFNAAFSIARRTYRKEHSMACYAKLLLEALYNSKSVCLVVLLLQSDASNAASTRATSGIN